MIAAQTLQAWLQEKGLYAGDLDGKFGPASRGAVNALFDGRFLSAPDADGWNDARKRFAAEQMFLEDHGFELGDIDGKYGPASQAAHEAWVKSLRETDPLEAPESPKPELPAPSGLIRNVWPRQADVPAFYGDVGENQIMVEVPYKIYYDGKPVKRMSLHTKVADSARRVFAAVLAEYGPDRINQLGLNVWCGSLNVRPIRGGTRMSMHSWGIAIDWDCNRNTLHMDHTKAVFARQEYNRFWEIWEAEGWVSLGRVRDFDWMHVQASRL